MVKSPRNPPCMIRCAATSLNSLYNYKKSKTLAGDVANKAFCIPYLFVCTPICM